jgi:hypothetical protein
MESYFVKYCPGPFEKSSKERFSCHFPRGVGQNIEIIEKEKG